MTKEQFLQVEISNISQVYFGKDRDCRCGCGGTYTATSYMKDPRSDVNDSLVEKRLKRAKKLVLEGAKTTYGDNYVNISTGNNKALTFYFDDLKK
jgi:hypothetical protein